MGIIGTSIVHLGNQHYRYIQCGCVCGVHDIAQWKYSELHVLHDRMHCK
jgi:hypothetical protein